METQDKKVKVTHAENGIEREFSQTQHQLMGKNNQAMFVQGDPAEATEDSSVVAQKTELELLREENARLKARKENAATEDAGKTAKELELEGLRAENAQLKADISTAGSLKPSEAPEAAVSDAGKDEDEGDDDPNPELTALRKSYETATGKKPGRLGVDKMNEAIEAAQRANTGGTVEVK